MHVMAGLAPAGASREALAETYQSNLAWAAAQAAPLGIAVLIEPINTRDIPRYYLNRQDQAHALVQAIGSASLQVQMDLYHCQIVEGDLAMKLRQYLPAEGKPSQVGHLQIAGVPDRHEPDLGEVNYPYLFDLIDALGYQGMVGCEYRPRAGTSDGLGWLRRYRAERA
jgi:hydroxypyruvate isomerase